MHHHNNTSNESNETHYSHDSFYILADCTVYAAGTFAGQEAESSRSQLHHPMGLEGLGQDVKGEGAAPIVVD